MTSKQAKGQKITEAIHKFIEDRDNLNDSADWIQKKGPKANKGVKREEVAQLIGCSKTALNENTAGEDLKEAEARWCAEYVKQQKSSQSTRAELERSRSAEKKAKRKVSSLSDENSVLMAENRLLRAALAKHENVQMLLMKNGRAPKLPKGYFLNTPTEDVND